MSSDKKVEAIELASTDESSESDSEERVERAKACPKDKTPDVTDEDLDEIIEKGEVPIILGLERHIHKRFTQLVSASDSSNGSNTNVSDSGSGSGDNSSEEEKEKEEEEEDDDDEDEVVGYAEINVRDWFKHIIGKDEKELRETINSDNCPFECQYTQTEGPTSKRCVSVKVRNLSDPSKTYDAGALYFTTISKLKKMVLAANEERAKAGPLTVHKPPLTIEYAEDIVNNNNNNNNNNTTKHSNKTNKQTNKQTNKKKLTINYYYYYCCCLLFFFIFF